MDAHGIREELRDMARRLATLGDDVRLPTLDYRAGRDTIFGPDVSVEGSPAHTRMRAVRVTMTIPPVMRDIAAMLAEQVDGYLARWQTEPRVLITVTPGAHRDTGGWEAVSLSALENPVLWLPFFVGPEMLILFAVANLCGA
jgi:hypothetical protein